MAMNTEVLVFRMVFFMALVGLSFGATFISQEALKVQESRRNLAEMNCPINFKHQNYTVITSKCKGPKYYGRICCPALKDFACPFSEALNGVNQNDCASIMFTFINYHGKYPPGLFFDKCVEGSFGMTCPEHA